VKADLDEDPVSAVEGWGCHMREYGIDPQQFYRELAADCDLVCRDGTLYPQCMGGSARLYFGIHDD
jgi:hypothetical protein